MTPLDRSGNGKRSCSRCSIRSYATHRRRAEPRTDRRGGRNVGCDGRERHGDGRHGGRELYRRAGAGKKKARHTKRADHGRRRSRSGACCARPQLMCRPGTGPGGWRRWGGRGPPMPQAAAAGSDQDGIMGQMRPEEQTAVSDEGAAEARSTSDQRERSLAVAERRRRKHRHHNATWARTAAVTSSARGAPLLGLSRGKT